MEINKKPEVGMTLEIILTGDEVDEILNAKCDADSRTREGERAWATVYSKYGSTIIGAVLNNKK